MRQCYADCHPNIADYMPAKQKIVKTLLITRYEIVQCKVELKQSFCLATFSRICSLVPRRSIVFFIKISNLAPLRAGLFACRPSILELSICSGIFINTDLYTNNGPRRYEAWKIVWNVHQSPRKSVFVNNISSDVACTSCTHGAAYCLRIDVYVCFLFIYRYE